MADRNITTDEDAVRVLCALVQWVDGWVDAPHLIDIMADARAVVAAAYAAAER